MAETIGYIRITNHTHRTREDYLIVFTTTGTERRSEDAEWESRHLLLGVGGRDVNDYVGVTPEDIFNGVTNRAFADRPEVREALARLKRLGSSWRFAA